MKARGKRGKTRENADDQIVIGVCVVSDSLRGWHEVSDPITERSIANAMQSRITSIIDGELLYEELLAV